MAASNGSSHCSDTNTKRGVATLPVNVPIVWIASLLAAVSKSVVLGDTPRGSVIGS